MERFILYWMNNVLEVALELWETATAFLYSSAHTVSETMN